jgi:hypothetical protein
MSWKTFKFFEYDEVKDPETNEPFNKLKDLGITCCSCGRGMIIFGDGSGFFHVMTSISDMFSIQAYRLRVQHIYQLKTRNIILTVGDDEDFCPLIRVWNLDKRDKQGNPTCARAIKAAIFDHGVQTQNTAVMAICAHENMNIIAVGFKDGNVIILRGNITRDRQSRQRIVHEEQEPGVYVTGLAFRQLGNIPVLMIATNKAVYSCFIKDDVKKNQIGDFGCELNCCTLTDHTQEFKFVIGTPELVQFYTTDLPAQCKAFEGDKFLVRWYRGYLITASEGAVRGGAIRGVAPGKGPSRESKSLTIYDMQNQFVAYQTTFQTRIVDVLSEWGSLYVLLKDGKLIRLDELDTKTKLETLFKKNLYDIAISLARSQSYSDGLVEIFTQYGDHLYSKGDYDGAITQYKLTIGTLEPSYVIRKFLDAQRIYNLTDYLKELHDKRQANADHTTLLLNCYTKLKNEEQLNAFVKEEQAPFDVEAAIKVCRQANYPEHALALARRFHEHNWYLLIVLEDLHRHEDALMYIRSLGFKAAESNMSKYGRTLIQELPEQTTELLIELCTDWKVGKEVSSTTQTSGAIQGPSAPCLKAKPDKFISAFVDKKEKLMFFLEEMIRIRECYDPVVCNTLLELYLTGVGIQDQTTRESRVLQLLKNPQAEYDVDHALMLARTFNFREGVLYLYEKTALYRQIVAYHMEHDDVNAVMETCKRFSQQEPSIWVQALTYFASREDCKEFIPRVLHHIEEKHLLQPLVVVQLLAQNRYATLENIKPYIVKHLEEQNEAIGKDERQIRDYKESTEQMRQAINELQSK